MSAKTETREKKRSMLKEPGFFSVVMHNDDFTTMDFVVRILVEVFHKDPLSAEAIMMHVHKNGRAVVGKYPYDIALTRVNTALSKAREEGFPFRMTIEEE